MMKRVSKILMIGAALLIGLTFLFPLWRFEIWAPQYPEGLFMQVWISKITGDLRNVNILNHYVGMHPITPESMPELVIFPWLMGFFASTALATAYFGRRALLIGWTTLFLVFATVSLVDFYKWEYKFGHELSPDAPIKMEESYQPPLIGVKQLMNITAWSLPATGGIALMGAVGLSVAALVLELKNRKGLAMALAAVALTSLQACTRGGPEELVAGKDSCHACKMTISDPKFGAEVVTAKGKVFKFDSLECMSSFFKTLGDKEAKIYVSDSTHPGQMIPAETAIFAIDKEKRGPMGRFILASRDAETLKKLPGFSAKETLQWKDMFEFLQSSPH